MSTTALGIDIGSHAVKAALLRRRGSTIQLVRAGSAPLEELGQMDDTPRKIAREAMIIRNLLRRIGATGHPARVAVGGRKTIIRYTRVPPAPEWRLKMLVDYEIKGDTSTQGEDLCYDFRLLDLPGAGVELAVMIAIARNELVENRYEILHDAGVDVANVTLTPFPLFETYLQNRGGTVSDDKNVLLVDVGAHHMNLAVERNGRLLFARNITPGGREFTEAVQDQFRIPFDEAERLKCEQGRLLLGGEATPGADDATQLSPAADAPTEVSTPDDDGIGLLMPDDPGLELSETGSTTTAQLSEAMTPVAGRLASAIQSSLLYCRAQTRMTDLEVDEMVLTGGGARLHGLRQALSRRLGIAAAPTDPLRNIDLGPLNRARREEVEQNAESYATAIGLALPGVRPDAREFCLLPPRIKSRRRFAEKTLYLWLSAAAMIALIVLVGISSWRYTGEYREHVIAKEARLEAGEKALRRMDGLLMVNAEYAAELERMQDTYLSPQQMLRVFASLSRHVPPEVEIDTVTVVQPQPRPVSVRRGRTPPPAPPVQPRFITLTGHVLERVPQRGGGDRVVGLGEAHSIIGKLDRDLIRDEVFEPPPRKESGLEVERTGSLGENRVGTFEIRLRLAKVTEE
jgi:type IV pilus assembly protein PilM